MYKLVFFVPADHKEIVKDALFAVGAGHQGLYSNCCWETPGTGQFLPAEGSNPTIGKANELVRVDEFRVEMLVDDELVPLCMDALREAHPYEEPAFEFFRVFNDESELSGQEWL